MMKYAKSLERLGRQILAPRIPAQEQGGTGKGTAPDGIEH